jgi:type IV pilus assembly protein PilY1
MQTRLLYATPGNLWLLLCMINLCLLFCPAAVLAAAPFPGKSYCSVPPMPGSGVKPNLLLLIDNSASMYDLAYTDPGNYCVDDSYNNAAGYPGYFDESLTYSYDFTVNQYFFASSVTLPTTGCNAANTGYLCLNIKNGTKNFPARKVDKFVASGKFLNWLSMSKLDIEKQILTGGKFQFNNGSKSQGLLVAETRGCQGKRFVKLLKEVPLLSFGVRGPIYSDADFVYRASHGGATRIEIYEKQYNKASCLKTIADWQVPYTAAAQQTLGKDATLCVGEDSLTDGVDDSNPPKPVPSKGKVFADIISNCYAYAAKMPGDGAISADCLLRIRFTYKNTSKVPMNVGDDICTSGVDHRLWGFPPNSSGYLGACYDSLCNCYKAGQACVDQEIEDYCHEMVNPALTDPVAGYSSGGNSNILAFILDAGIYSVANAAGTFRARVSAPAPPTGLLQQFSSDINFGAMIFNDNGAGTECKALDPSLANGGLEDGDIPCTKRCKTGTTDSGRECQLDSDCGIGTCQTVPLSDGGKLISAINSPLGDHNPASGLIAALDQVTADSWSPVAESLYGAIGYFGALTDPRSGSHLWPQSSASYGAPPSQFSCQGNNVLIVSDGASTADRHPDVSELLAGYLDRLPSGMTTNVKAGDSLSSPPSQGSYNLDDLAWLARNVNTANFSKVAVNNKELLNKNDFISTYAVYTGAPCGGYNPDGSCNTTDEGVPEKMMQLTTSKGGGKMVAAQSPSQLNKAFEEILQQIAAGSGTDVSILSSGEGNGALFLQEQFYPGKSFDGGSSSTAWIGEMQCLWYYIDPFLGGTAGAGSTIREDTVADKKLDLKADRIVSLGFDAIGKQSYAKLTTDVNGDGLGGGTQSVVELSQLKSLWQAGQQLWARDLTDSPRTIYLPLLSGGTQVNASGLMKLSASSAGPVTPYLNLQTGDPDAGKLINFVHGFDFPDLRSRSVKIAGVAATLDPEHSGVGTWKLGDIIGSNRQVQSPTALASYHLPSPTGYGDASYQEFLNSTGYRSRGTVYVGANDGMLHAFKLGTLVTRGSALLDPNNVASFKAALTGDDPGKEQWAFIPKNALPYLKYLSDPRYQHLYVLDGKSSLIDASIGDTNIGSCTQASYWTCPKTAGSWRTVLIGSMGLGGASAKACTPGSNCVPTPLLDPAAPTAGFGYSSYFALDVTDPDNPSLLWEFSNPALGYSTSGPAIMRIGERQADGSRLNGRWFAVFGSGPTGPVKGDSQQFLARSNQTLKLFIVDLRNGTLLKTIDTGIAEAFAGSMIGGAIDVDRWNPDSAGNYQDDAVYLGYTKKVPDSDSNSDNWTDGGVLRLVSNESLDPNDLTKPWTVGTLIDGIGPVTSGVARIQDRRSHRLWLYFGTGRYFFSQDDLQTRRALYGVKDPCYNVKEAGVNQKLDDFNQLNCTASVTATSLIDQSTTEKTVADEDAGWIIGLDPAIDGVDGVGAERLTTNPSPTTGGALLFTSFQPSKDLCLFGNSFLWGVKYDTGGVIPDGLLQGKALVPLSTGGLQETGLSSKLTDKGGRRSGPMPGRPRGIKLVSNSGLRPLKKIIHLQER